MNLLILAAIVAPLLYFWNKLAPSLPHSGTSLPGGIAGPSKKKKAKKSKKAALPNDLQVPTPSSAVSQPRSVDQQPPATAHPTDHSKENLTTPETFDLPSPRKPKLSQKQAKKLLRQQRQDRRDSKQKRIDESPNVSDGVAEEPAEVPAAVTDTARATTADHGILTDSEDEREPARILRVKGPDETLSLTEREESDGWQVVDVHA
ncbi:hypothetical protein HK097_010876, partial [Rhizophlyctis rosea]